MKPIYLNLSKPFSELETAASRFGAILHCPKAWIIRNTLTMKATNTLMYSYVRSILRICMRSVPTILFRQPDCCCFR